MTELTFKDEGIEIEIRGEREKVERYADRLKNDQNPTDTLGMILKKGKEDPNSLDALLNVFGIKKDSHKISSVLGLITNLLK